MQLLFDFLPIVIFAVAYVARGIYVATAALMVATAVQVAYQWIRHRKVNKMLLASSVIVAVFGALTLILRNEQFIKWKVTVVYGLFAAAFLGSQFFAKKTLAELMLGQVLKLDAAFWRQLNVVWAVVFFALGAVNIYVAHEFSTGVWVAYKVAAIVVTLLTLIGQLAWIYKRAPEAFAELEEKGDDDAKRETPGGGP